MFGSGTKKLQRVEDLLQEQNQLLRELIYATTGRQSQTPRRQPLPEGFKPRTASDVTVVTREALLKQQREAQQKETTSASEGLPVR